jgi:cell division protein FtsQ
MKTREQPPLLSTRAMQRIGTLMLAVAALVFLAGAAGWLVKRPWFDLREIELHAAAGAELRHVNVNTVRAATLGRLSGNFFTLRLDDARRVFEAVPWVAAVSVRRAWPNRLIVTVIEHRAIAVWDDGRLLSDKGQVFVANVAEAEAAGPLWQVDAPPRLAADVAQRLPTIAARLQKIGLALDGVEVSERSSWTLRTEAGPTIELGRDEPPGRLDERLATIVGYFPLITAQLGGDLLRIDARYPQGFAVAAPRKKP